MDMDTQKFIVVKFIEENELSVVSKRWLEDQCCHFPTNDDISPEVKQNAGRDVLKFLVTTHADPAGWQTYDCKLYEGEYDEFKDADAALVKYLNKSETADDDSDGSKLVGRMVLRNRRSKKKPGEEEKNESHGRQNGTKDTLPSIPTPPPPPKLVEKQANSQSSKSCQQPNKGPEKTNLETSKNSQIENWCLKMSNSNKEGAVERDLCNGSPSLLGSLPPSLSQNNPRSRSPSPKNKRTGRRRSPSPKGRSLSRKRCRSSSPERPCQRSSSRKRSSRRSSSERPNHWSSSRKRSNRRSKSPEKSNHKSSSRKRSNRRSKSPERSNHKSSSRKRSDRRSKSPERSNHKSSSRKRSIRRSKSPERSNHKSSLRKRSNRRSKSPERSNHKSFSGKRSFRRSTSTESSDHKRSSRKRLFHRKSPSSDSSSTVTQWVSPSRRTSLSKEKSSERSPRRRSKISSTHSSHSRSSSMLSSRRRHSVEREQSPQSTGRPTFRMSRTPSPFDDTIATSSINTRNDNFNSPILASPVSSAPPATGYDAFLNDEVAFRKVVIQSLAFLKVLITKLVNRVPGFNTTLRDPEVAKLDKRLPLNSSEDLTIVDAELSEESQYNRMVSILSQSGGHDVGAATRSSLRKLITDEVQVMFSWDGAKRKSRFRDLKNIVNVLYDSVRVHHPDAKPGDIEKFIKGDLKNAKQRCSKKEIKDKDLVPVDTDEEIIN